MALFEDTSDTEITADQLVGEGKKFKTFDDLARSKAHADKTIADREAELAQLREDLNTRLSVEEQLKQFQKATTIPPENQAPNQPNNSPQENQDLAKRVREVIDQERQETSRRTNQQLVQDKLAELYGTPEKAAQVVRAKAQELGVSIQFMESIALQSPKAFFTQLGVAEPSRNQAPVTPSRGDVNTLALGINTGIPKEGSYEAFEEMRKTNPTLYWNPKTQSRIHKAAADGTYVVPDPVYEL